jgi:hypothetical protein
MTMTWPNMALQAGALAIALGFAPAAMAEGSESTDTAGPAAGTQTSQSAAGQQTAPTVKDRTAARSPGAEGQKGPDPSPASKGSSTGASTSRP